MMNIGEATIVIGTDSSAAEQNAARELAKYLQIIFDRAFLIVPDTTAPEESEISVGKTNREPEGTIESGELGTDGFIIQIIGNRLFLRGGSDRGTLYAVYEFLEKYLDCRFFAENAERIPKKEAFSLNELCDKQSSPFECRNVLWKPFFGEQISVKRRINEKSGERILTEEWGGGISYVGGFVHTFERLVDFETYWEKHPEYYSMGEDGERNKYQLCLSNPEVLAVVIERVRTLLRENPDAAIVSISQNDGGNPCLCEHCRKIYEEENGAYSGAVIRFVNAVARAIREEYPDVKLDTLAYQYTRDVPKTKPEDNVVVRLCSIECCYSHPMSECDEMAYKAFNSTVSANSFKEDFVNWGKICNSLHIWDYTTNFTHYNMTFPNFGVLLKNARFFAENHATGVFEQGNYQSEQGEFAELRGYLLSKVLWNPYMSEGEYERHMDEFLEGFYGVGGRYIKEYISLAEAEPERIHFSIYTSPEALYPSSKREAHQHMPEDISLEMVKNYETTDWTPYLDWYTCLIPNVVVTKGYELFGKALDMAENEQTRERISKSMIQVEYLDSYFRREQKEARIQNICRMLDEILKDEEHASDMKENVLDYLEKGLNKGYYMFNRALGDKMKKYGISRVGELRMPFAQMEKPDYNAVPGDWNAETE